MKNLIFCLRSLSTLFLRHLSSDFINREDFFCETRKDKVKCLERLSTEIPSTGRLSTKRPLLEPLRGSKQHQMGFSKLYKPKYKPSYSPFRPLELDFPPFPGQKIEICFDCYYFLQFLFSFSGIFRKTTSRQFRPSI